MTDEQFNRMMTALENIDSYTLSSRDGGYDVEQTNEKLDKIIELLEKLVKLKGSGR